jgi:predicted O-methyltransferase YrrM
MAMSIEIAIVNHNTDSHLLNLLASIAAHLPAPALHAVHVWDNASDDRSLETLQAFRGTVPWLRVHASPSNVHHGVALDRLLRKACARDWVLVLDSDTEIARDFLPGLPSLVEGDPAFVGQIHPQAPQLYAYLAHVLINRAWYLRLPAFAHDGAPARAFFRAIEQRQIPYRRFRWCDYVRHSGQGTLRRLVERGDTANEFYAFARREAAAAPASPEREARERAMKDALGVFLTAAGTGEAGRCARGPAAAGHDDPCSAEGERLEGKVDGRGSWPAVSPGQSEEGSDVRRRRRPDLRAALSPRWAWTLRRARRIGLVQQAGEIRALLAIVARLRPSRLLEIGTSHGGSFYLWTRVAAPDALLVSVDRPPWELDDPGEPAKVQALRRFGRPGQHLHLIRTDSHDAATLEAVRQLLGPGGSLDFLFIDGDHSADGVRRDWLDYAPLVRAGGLIALHDIHPHSRGWGGDVPAFWREIKSRYRTEEIIERPQQDGFGIGLVWL